MDEKLIRWARAVKARSRARGGPSLPPLWVFADRERLPDPAAALRSLPRSLPRGLCGLVLRPGIDPAAARRAVALCRARRFAVVAVGWPGVGRHVPRHQAIPRRGTGLLTASAHDGAELVRARRGRVDCVFLSPAYATASHPGAAALGAVRWSRLAHSVRTPVMALGGITGATVARLSRDRCAGVGVIGAMLEPFVAAAPQCSANTMTAL